VGEVAIGVVFSHDPVAASDEGFNDLKVMDWAIGVEAHELGPTFKVPDSHESRRQGLGKIGEAG
jgi:hypothetical protein